MLKSFPSFSPPPLSLMYYNVLQSLESKHERGRMQAPPYCDLALSPFHSRAGPFRTLPSASVCIATRPKSPPG